jgi:hypothetical protein
MTEIDMDKPVVSAASIIAKVERDRTLRELEQKVLSDMHRSSRILKCRAARAAARIRISFGSNHQSFLSKIGINLKGALHNKFFFFFCGSSCRRMLIADYLQEQWPEYVRASWNMKALKAGSVPIAEVEEEFYT